MAIFVMIVVSMLAEWAGVVMNEAPEMLVETDALTGLFS